MKRRKSSVQMPEAAINITSLLDITFVLLIAFMVVAPALKYNIDLDLPKVGESTPRDSEKPVAIQVKLQDGASQFYVNGKEVILGSLAQTVKESSGFQPESATVALEADRMVPWEDIARLINELKMNGITNIGIVTEKGEKR